MYTRTSGFSHYKRAVCRFAITDRGRACHVSPGTSGLACQPRRGVAQLAEQRSPKPQVAGSSPVAPAEGDRPTTMQAGRLRWGYRPLCGGETDTTIVGWWTLGGVA